MALSGLGLRVAGMTMQLGWREGGAHLGLPDSHLAFRSPPAPEGDQPQDAAWLALEVVSEPTIAPRETWVPVCRTEIWELWRDPLGRDVYIAPRQAPVRQALIAPDYARGEVRLGPLEGQDALYPLQGLDNLILSNWLAQRGDVILHASGVVLDGRAYCFIGPSGAGKSTIAAHLQSAHGALVLGEDQVALRYIAGQFQAFGTPWHLNPGMCSPQSAPLAGLFSLDRAAPQPVTPLSAGQGVARLLASAFVPFYRPEALSAIMARFERLAAEIPLATLAYRIGDDVLRHIVLS